MTPSYDSPAGRSQQITPCALRDVRNASSTELPVLMYLTPLIVFLVCVTTTAVAQNVLVTGTVVDASTREPLPGATLRLVDKSRGTYTSPTGGFRFPLPSGTHRVVVSSLGYVSDTVSLTTRSSPSTIALQPTSIDVGGVDVSARLSADDVVRSAIVRKADNLARLKTFNGLLYSKFSFDLAGNAFGQIEDEDRAIIMETFSRYYYDHEETPPVHIDIVNRRQTANIPSQGNLFALGNFVSFYDDELPLLNARVMTPLAEDAFSRYRFEYVERTKAADQSVYIIKVIPTTRVLPAFIGTMKIDKVGYNLVEVDLKPTEATAIAFVRDLHFVQRFEQLADNVWYPTFMEITGAATVEIVKGFAQIDATVRATSIVSEAIVNQPLADSVFGPRAGLDGARGGDDVIIAAPDADSTRPEFWENNALSELSSEEKETYARIDSLVANADTARRERERGLSFSALPSIDFNRVAGITLIGNASVDIGSWADVGASVAYGFAIKRPFVELDATISLIRERNASLSFAGSAFSKLGTNHWDRSIPRLLNTATASLFHRDYYDWFRQDGWNAAVNANLFGVGAVVGIEMARHLGVGTSATRSIFDASPLRTNPIIPDGNYRVFNGSLSYGRSDDDIVISSGSRAEAGVKLSAVTGEDTRSAVRFQAAEAKLSLELPTFGTGYVPMSLRIAVHAGTGSYRLPIEYQFRMRTAAAIISPFGHFMSAPIAAYGGTRYIAVHAEHNFSDIVWRWIGLPTYWGRGVEFIVSVAAGRFEHQRVDNKSDWMIPMLEVEGLYMPTGDAWYSEAGFGIGRIPTFISNVAFLRVDARFGIGSLARGNWGVALSLSSPF